MGCCPLQARYEKRRGEGGGCCTLQLFHQARIQNVLEAGAEKLARAKFLATTPILVFILETEEPPEPRPPKYAPAEVVVLS